MQGEVLGWLQAWYLEQCDGDWEHNHGVKIDTLDNPGWMVAIDVLGTPMEGETFSRIEKHHSEHDWVISWLEDSKFQAACGPTNLIEALETFREWVTQNPRR